MDKFRKRINKWSRNVPQAQLQQKSDPSFLTFVVPCMGRLSQLKQSLPTVVTQPGTEYVLVDWSCPDQSGSWVRQNYKTVKVIRVDNEELFNLSKARNLGGRAVTTPWVCFIDADMLLEPNFSSSLDLQPGTLYLYNLPS